MTDSMIPVPVDDPLELAWCECNDSGNARRFAALSGGLVKWVDDKAWVAFDGQRWWEREGGFRARALAHEVARHINTEVTALAELVGDPDRPNTAALTARYGEWCTPERALDRIDALRKWAVRSGNAAQTDAMLKQAKDMAELRAWNEAFDVDPLAFNVANGTLRFVQVPRGTVPKDYPHRVFGDGELVWIAQFREGHEPFDYLRQMAGVAYDPGAECPMWTARFELLQPDAEVRAVLPPLYGQCLTGLTDGEEFYTHQGEGRDGKSKTHDVLARLFGDYYRHVGVKTWLAASFQKSGAEHRRDLVDLAGDVRFIISEEPPVGSTWDSELLKQWTGGGSITAFGAGAKDATVYKPRGKVNAECNKLPRAPSDDRGWWDRQCIIPWPVYVPGLPGGAEPAAALVARLMTEGPGILNWLIDGCLEWLVLRKVPRAARMADAVSSARSGSSPIAEWLAEECSREDKSHREGATVLYNAFKAWCERQGLEKVPSQKSFGTGLTDRQIYVDKDGKGLKLRVGIKLLSSDPLLRGAAGSAAAQGFAGGAGSVAEPPRAGEQGGRYDDSIDDDDPFGQPG